MANDREARTAAIEQYQRAMANRKRALPGGAWKSDWYHELAERARDAERRGRR